MPVKKRVIQVPFEHIIVDDSFNCRKEYTKISELAQSIFEDGLLQPLGVTTKPQDDGVDKYFLVYGFRRYRALQKLRDDHGDDYYAVLEVVINEGTSEEMRIRNLKENIERESLSAYEIAQQIKRMVLAGFDQHDIGVKLGRNQSWVSYHHKVATKLGASAQLALKNGELTMDQALYITDIPEQEQESLVTQVLQAESKAEAKQLLKKASKTSDTGQRRKYGNKGRPNAKNMAALISEVSFQAESTQYTKEERKFFNGVAAGLRIALGDPDVDPKSLEDSNKYSDPDYDKRAKKLEEDAAPEGVAAAEDDAETSDAEINEAIADTQQAEEDPYALPAVPAMDDDAESPRVVYEADAETTEIIEDGEPQQIRGIAEPLKKKRGRPRKNPVAEGKRA